MNKICDVCKKSVARWQCMTCKKDSAAICPDARCVQAHESACTPEPDPRTTVGLLRLALTKEPYKDCTARPRCAPCRDHDGLRDAIARAIELARKHEKG